MRRWVAVAGISAVVIGSSWSAYLAAQPKPTAAGGSATVPPTNTGALLSAQLDRPITVDVKGRLPEVMDQIMAAANNVPITADESVWDLLPWGQDTTLNAKINNQSLRQALDAITRKLGLTFVVRPESVELVPMPALHRLARRATIAELAALDKLASTPLDTAKPQMTVKELLAAIGAKLADDKNGYAVENRASDAVNREQAVKLGTSPTLAEALEELVDQTNATWYPWGKTVVIIDKADEVRRLLARPTGVHYNGVDVAQVLMDLQSRSGVHFEIEPGAIQRVPADARTVRLTAENLPFSDVLEAIGGFTGLAYAVRDNGVYLSNPAHAAAPVRAAPAFGLLTTDVGFQVIVPENEMPADVKEYLNAKKQEAWKHIRQTMEAEHFKPAAPAAPAAATQPDKGKDL